MKQLQQKNTGSVLATTLVGGRVGVEVGAAAIVHTRNTVSLDAHDPRWAKIASTTIRLKQETAVLLLMPLRNKLKSVNAWLW